ncbi:unnamed protein product [Symbiodinium sp. CCMP2592]|nr:unnamed protein product [Symbiodinium sp. CCMP2592]
MQLLVRDLTGQIVLQVTLRGHLPLHDLSRQVREAKPEWMHSVISFLSDQTMLQNNWDFQKLLRSGSDLELTAVAEEQGLTFEEAFSACQEILLEPLRHAHGGNVSLDCSFTHLSFEEQEKLHRKLMKHFDCRLSVALFEDYRTVREISEYVYQENVKTVRLRAELKALG